MREGLTFVHDALLGVGLRDQIRIGVSGKIITAFDIARAMALGADWCNSARGFMFALGCIQSLSCHTIDARPASRRRIRCAPVLSTFQTRPSAFTASIARRWWRSPN